MPDKTNTHRLFFALWPDEQIRRQISQQVMPQLEYLKGRKVSQHQWHITLAFLGSVTDEVMQCAIEQAGQIRSNPFEMSLDMLGHWTCPRVVWLGCSEPPDVLTSLVESLNQKLGRCGYTPEHKTFQAHMTLMRKVTRKPKPIQFHPLSWRINEFVLVESQLDNTGSQYVILQRWSLPGLDVKSS